MGDFHEPYGAIFGEFDKLSLCSCRFCLKFTFYRIVIL